VRKVIGTVRTRATEAATGLDGGSETVFNESQLVEISKLVALRTEQDFHAILDQLIAQARSMKVGVRTIRPRTTTAFALTAADGGNNSVEFNPFSLQIVRVVDSRGRELLLDIVSPTSDVKEISRAHLENGQASTALGRLMVALGVSELAELSPMLSGKSPSWVQVYRDLCEWATLFELVTKPGRDHDTLIVRDGLLRSKVFNGDLFMRMYSVIKNAIDLAAREDHVRVWLVGLAKHTNLLESYRLAISLAGVFEPGEPCYAMVTDEMLGEVYKWEEYYRNPEEPIDRRHEDPKFNMGRMHLVRFGTRSGDPIWTVDLLESQRGDHQAVFGALLQDAIDGFPVPFYPLCLQNADKFSRVDEFDTAIVQDRLLAAVRKIVGPDSSPVIDRLRLATDVSARRYE